MLRVREEAGPRMSYDHTPDPKGNVYEKKEGGDFFDEKSRRGKVARKLEAP